ncbi:hypothetical protein [Roseovarius aestuariivivens]|uniref:hypothetical protein n=1 Tax=Roseovarius aestuariivivens TaxID=1888910 RepID=UPI001080A9C2|nr:hypothetical protein [Roseovarius aestuariivivens]
MSKAKPLKKHLAALEAKLAQCEDATESENLKKRVACLRRDLEQAGYLSPTIKQPKSRRRKRRNKKASAGSADPLVRAKSKAGFFGTKIRFVRGGSMSKK